MSSGEIFLILLVVVIGGVYIRRFLLIRSVKHYSPSEVSELMKRGNVVLLDVRTNDERAISNIKGSIHIPLNQLGRRMDELKRHKDKEIVCYCQTGNRSLTAAARMEKAGFTVANLKGGIGEWNYFIRAVS
jgi:rhodanese-related sulfurtransferase